jgi:hypothetical protein
LFPTPDAPPGCPTRAADGGVVHEADGAACVTIDASTYDTSCVEDSDCVAASFGELCEGAPQCSNPVAINHVAKPRYDEARAAVSAGAAPCPLAPAPRCVNEHCAL